MASLATGLAMRAADFLTRFERSFFRGDAGECWLWHGRKNAQYGLIRLGGAGSRQVLAHRFPYVTGSYYVNSRGFKVCKTCTSERARARRSGESDR